MGAPVVRFEIMGGNGSQLEEFYRELFGWKIDSNNPMKYGMVDTGSPGINGGVGASQDGGHRVSVYIQVENLDATLTKAEKLGGKIILPPSQVPSGPKLAMFADPAGNVTGLLLGKRVGQMTTQTSFSEKALESGFMISKMQLWVGRIMSALASLFLLVDGVMKLLKPPVVVKATLQLGYAESAIVGIGATLLVCTLLYVVPRSSTVGAAFLTAYLGGAVASNVRAGMPAFNVLFPVIMAGLVWGGLWFRDLRVRDLVRG